MDGANALIQGRTVNYRYNIIIKPLSCLERDPNPEFYPGALYQLSQWALAGVHKPREAPRRGYELLALAIRTHAIHVYACAVL